MDERQTDTLENNTEEMLNDALGELKKQRKKEKFLLTTIIALTISSMAFGYTVWQNKADAYTTDSYYYGGTPTAYDLSADTAGGGGGGCGSGGSASSGGGGCCGGGSSDGVATTDPKEVETLARLFYTKNFGDDTGLKFNVADYGCHIQIDVYENDKIIKSLVYRGGQISEY